MTFTSGLFIVFLLLTVLAYYAVPKKGQWIVLLIADLVFYLCGGLKMIFYLLFTALTTYLAGRMLGTLNARRQDLPKEERNTTGRALRKRMRLIVFCAMLLIFGLLYMVKYWNFTAPALHLPQLGLILPLGISFYTFQSAGYVIDCYRGTVQPEKNPARYLLFVSFFPQMVQGPISRFSQLSGQLNSPHPFDAENLRMGIQLMLWGYCKKMIVADRAAVLVNKVFAEPSAYSGAFIALAVLFYCIELYCDFSGGIDITRGAARMFGVDMIENFRRPIFATSLTDYWRRWHISLGQWMRDYVFYPMSLSKPMARLGRFTRRKIGGKLGKIIPTSLVTFFIYFIIGIWHGANFRYIAFGFWNGFWITLALLLAGPFETVKTKLHIPDKSRWYHAWTVVRTWVIVFIGRYITRAPRLKTAVYMIGRTLRHFEVSSLTLPRVLSLGLTGKDLLVILCGLIVLLTVETLQERGVQIRATLAKKHAVVQLLCLLALCLSLYFFGILRGSHIATSFIYQQY